MAVAHISCTDAYIGTCPTIKITTDFAVMTLRLEYHFGDTAGYIPLPNEEYTSEVTDWVIPTDFYHQIPHELQGLCLLTLEAIGLNPKESSTAQCTFMAKVNPSFCKPTIGVPQIRDTNAASVALTGDSSKLIRYVSSAYVEAERYSNYGTWIDYSLSYVTNSGRTSREKYPTFDGVDNPAFYIFAKDVRGLSTGITYTVPADRFIEYIKLTCNAGDERPDTSGSLRLTCSGNYFNGSFGAVNNVLFVEYRYKEKGGDFGAWRAMVASVNGNTYSAYADITGLDYKTTYVFECRATDAAMTISSAESVTQATPVFHWGENDFVHETVVDFRAGIMFNGVEGDYIEEQGTANGWRYRKWNSGLAECWLGVNKSISASSWVEYDGWYEAELLIAREYPFPFEDTQNEYATIQSACGGFLNGSAIGMSSTTTGSYFITRLGKLTGTYSCRLNLYAVGRWK